MWGRIVLKRLKIMIYEDKVLASFVNQDEEETPKEEGVSEEEASGEDL